MIITRHDRPIGKARAGGITIIEEKPVLAECPYTLKASDTHQMTWNQLCRATGRQSSTFWYRVNRYGMAPLQALTSPAEPYQHVMMSMGDLCRLVGIDRRTFNSRRRLGWGFREALLTPVAARASHQEAA